MLIDIGPAIDDYRAQLTRRTMDEAHRIVGLGSGFAGEFAPKKKATGKQQSRVIAYLTRMSELTNPEKMRALSAQLLEEIHA